MKSKILFYIAVGLAFLTVSCDSYLDKEPDDMQTIEGVFAKRSTTEQYLANAYAYLPEQYSYWQTEYCPMELAFCTCQR